MIDLLYMLVATPICAALASISICRLNNLDPHNSRANWIVRYLLLGFIAACMGLEAIMQPAIFDSVGLKVIARVFGLSVCAIALYGVLQTRYKWVGRRPSGMVDNTPIESNRSPLGEL